jgi:hypothetical protein
VYSFEAAHNPEVAGSNPAPATPKGSAKQGLLLFEPPQANPVRPGFGDLLWRRQPISARSSFARGDDFWAARPIRLDLLAQHDSEY